MNKKGVTLVEVVISVGLIALVMLFLFNLLIDMQYEESHSSMAKENQLNRAAIIKTLQTDFMELNLKNAQRNIYENYGVILFEFQNGSKSLQVTNNKVSYISGGVIEEAWVMGEEGAQYDYKNIEISKIEKSETCSTVTNPNSGASENVCSSYETIFIRIPVVTEADANILDDIELFYMRRAI